MNEQLSELFSKYYHKPPNSIGFVAEYVERTEQLLAFCIKHNIKSIYDAGCGELNWMDPRRLISNNIAYSGGDISVHSVEYCHGHFLGIDIKHHDMTTDPFPEVDLIFSSDVVIHLSDDDRRKFLNNFVRSGSKYVMITDDRGVKENISIDYSVPFPWQPINWAIDPWNLPPEIDLMPDLVPQGDIPSRRMSMWSREQIEKRLR